MNVDKLSPQQLNKVSAMLMLNVTFDENLKPIDNPQNYELLESFHNQGIYINLDGWDWNPLEDDRDLFTLLRDGSISMVKDGIFQMWDVGVMTNRGENGYWFSGNTSVSVSDEDLSKEVVKLYISIKIKENESELESRSIF